MIYELLAEGQENARTGRELAEVLNCNIREITQQIEAERRQGRPICAASGEKPGYYLPASPEELEHYCKRLKSRAIELFKTRQALIQVLKGIRDNAAEGAENGTK